jgi:hypothetical protein
VLAIRLALVTLAVQLREFHAGPEMLFEIEHLGMGAAKIQQRCTIMNQEATEGSSSA